MITKKVSRFNNIGRDGGSDGATPDYVLQSLNLRKVSSKSNSQTKNLINLLTGVPNPIILASIVSEISSFIRTDGHG